ncbi:MAG: hypothetical protein ACYS5V_07605 [Planctomycetota bacterium]|jgi:hypothetical protein
MIMEAGLPPEALEDPFRPPDEPVMVRCLHCDREYSSDKIFWERQDDGKGMWVCGIEGCGGAGFGFDIFPLDSGMWADDDEWDEEEGGGDVLDKPES